MAHALYAELVNRLRAHHRSLDTRDLQWRRDELQALRALIVEHEQDIFDALHSDLHKCRVECYLTETGFVLGEIDHALGHMERWSRPVGAHTPLYLQPAHSRVIWEPLGVALIMGPWNYPFHLVIAPLVPCLAAGNAAVLKPSELAPATSAVIGELVPQYLDPDVVAVVEGGVPETTALLQHRFDRIFFTGSARVGRIVMEAAAQHLTPVTLELGGKCPCVVDGSARLDVAARRVANGKFANAGQTCVAPDYALVQRDIADEFVAALADALGRFYGPDPQQSPDYARIINERHHDRLVELLADGEAVVGGEHDRADLYVAPTVLRGVDARSPVMQEEIFGPILPVLEVADAEEAIAFINERPRPLALYVFADDGEVVQRVTHTTRAGGTCVNETLLHLLVSELPFGGVGRSGMGTYHGEWGFREFSNARAILDRSTVFDIGLRYPPYSERDEALLRHMRG
ncbi:MAG: aldehyde dehydrogenase family protein [Armatimonadota bacterium]